MIEVKNLSFSYGKMPVYVDIDLTFRNGAIYGLLGENGVGKTTMLKLISGLLAPGRGTCRVDEWNASDRTPEMLQEVFYLADTVALPVGKTPQQYVRTLQPFYPRFEENKFMLIMEQFEVDPQWKFNEMSYGQQKKSLIAAAMSFGTRYLLLDEPTNGLDIPSKTSFRSLLAGFLDEEKTIIISTHQVKDVENLIDPIVILTRNDVLLNASIEEITKVLKFEYGATGNPAALYSELQPGGFLNVMQNVDGSESQLSVEALFNAVHRNPQLIKQLFADL